MNLTRSSFSILLLLTTMCFSCATMNMYSDSLDPETKKFLMVDPESEETFHVYVTSDRYIVSQMNHINRIKRIEDPVGDKYMCMEFKTHDKIDETREGVYVVVLFPDSGTIMRIRPKEPTFLSEIDTLIVEDLQRWEFEFPSGYIYPTKMRVRYRVKLRKTISDDEIFRELRKKLKEKSQ